LKPIESFVNQIIYGDCIQVLPLIPSSSVDLAITDPPYLVNYRPRDGRTCAGDDTEYWLRPAFKELYRVLKHDRLCVCFYGWPWIDRFMEAWRQSGFRPVSHLTWVKTHCSRVGYTRSYHEVAYLLAKGNPSKPFEPPRDVLPWEYTGNELHSNQKPVIGITPLIEAYSKPGDIVIDPFAGSGTTAIATNACDRRFILIEKVWHHVQVSRQRLNKEINHPTENHGSVHASGEEYQAPKGGRADGGQRKEYRG
jgi:adenine-specific DNA-methyltransferase